MPGAMRMSRIVSRALRRKRPCMMVKAKVAGIAKTIAAITDPLEMIMLLNIALTKIRSAKIAAKCSKVASKINSGG